MSHSEADVKELLQDLQSKDTSRRKEAAEKLGELTVSNEEIVLILETIAELDGDKDVAEAARKALLAPAHQKILQKEPQPIVPEPIPPIATDPHITDVTQDKQKLPLKESPKPQSVALGSFEATQMGILFKRPKWKVSIFPELVEFTSSDDKEHINITKEEGKNCIEFASAFVSEYNVKFNQGGKEYQFKLGSKDLNKLRSWMIPKTASEIASDIKQALIIRGVGLILVGIAHFVFSSYLNPIWGGVLIVVGVLSFFVSSRYIFLANGIVLILASVMNCYALVMAGPQNVQIPGGVAFAQIVWGLEEIVKFREYGLSEKRITEHKT